MHAQTTYDVRTFGASGDGKSDDTHAIQSALDAAGTCEGSVFIPSGNYLCGELRVPPAIYVHGVPAYNYYESHGTVLQLTDPKASCLLNLTGATGSSLYGLCLHGGMLKGKTPIHGIMVRNSHYGPAVDTPRIDTCRVERFSGDGMHMERIWCFSVRHSHSIHNDGCGLYVRGWDGFIIDNWFSGNGMAGFGAYEENAAITLTANRIEWNHQCGIDVRGGNHYNMTGNYIDRSGRCGIAVGPRGDVLSHSMTITGNLLYRSGNPENGLENEYDSVHVKLQDSAGIVCSGNAFNAGRGDQRDGEWSPEYGIVLKALRHCVIKDNVMFNAALKSLVVDLGTHGEEVIVEHNVGMLMNL